MRSDISSSMNLIELWDQAEAAGEFVLLPRSTYKCRLSGGHFCQSRKGTIGYRITFEVIEGEFLGCQVSHFLWLTSRAVPLAKRDLAKLGITSLDQLRQPLPQGLLCDVTVVLRRDDDEIERNQVRTFIVTGTEQADPFTPEN